MYTTYYERMELARTREAERQMLFKALRQRRGRLTTRRFLAPLTWLLGVIR